MSGRHSVDLIVENIGRLYTLAGSEKPRLGKQLADVGIVENAVVGCLKGRIVAAGSTVDLSSSLELCEGGRRIDAGGAAVIPGFVDAHTHAVFAHPRSDEFGRRLVGESYVSIAQSGGGIRASVRHFREIDPERLVELTRERLRACLRHGSTTVEIKSGYGLDLANEQKALRAAKQLDGEPGLPQQVRTCLAAHEVPDEFREDRAAYLDLVCDTILPAIAEEKLATRVDVFCEPHVFSVEESRRVLARGRALGLAGTVHADELAPSGGAELAAEMGADSADHLGCISEAGIEALATSGTVGVLLPGTIFSLGLDNWAPARRMIDAGVTVALATDFNPGSNYCESMPLIMAIGCTRMALHPHEALTMTTLNAAHALGIAGEVGSIEPGKRADLLILRAQSIDELCHHLGIEPIERVIMGGNEEWTGTLKSED